MSYIIAVDKPWCKDFDLRLSKKLNSKFIEITDGYSLNLKYLEKIKPKKIFFPFWSNIIKKEIYEKYECVIFHMTDLPFGRGGSPLQNLIIRNFKETKISALKCEKIIDAGPVYLKEDLNLNGSAEEIYIRASEVIEKMIENIILMKLKPKKQNGKVIKFSRRKKDDGDWSKSKSLDEVYNYIRMLDSEHYPKSYVKIGKFVLEFSECNKRLEHLSAKVIIKKEENE